MSDDLPCRVDWTSVTHQVDTRLDQSQSRWLRGAVARHANRPEFHQHGDRSLIYRHPLIRYDVSTGAAVIAGISAGALLLRSLPPFGEFRLGPETHPVIDRRVELRREAIGPTSEPVTYGFQSPYLALNHENHRTWERSRGLDRRRLLERIVVGNLLSLSKAVGLHVATRLRGEIDLVPDGWEELKPGVRLLGFRGTFRVNFALPDRWGIGKSSSRGFGTVTRLEA